MSSQTEQEKNLIKDLLYDINYINVINNTSNYFNTMFINKNIEEFKKDINLDFEDIEKIDLDFDPTELALINKIINIYINQFIINILYEYYTKYNKTIPEIKQLLVPSHEQIIKLKECMFNIFLYYKSSEKIMLERDFNSNPTSNPNLTRKYKSTPYNPMMVDFESNKKIFDEYDVSNMSEIIKNHISKFLILLIYGKKMYDYIPNTKLRFLDYLINGKQIKFLQDIYPFTNYCNLKKNYEIDKNDFFEKKNNPINNSICIMERRFLKKNFNPEDSLEPLRDTKFMNIKQYTTISTELIKLNENKNSFIPLNLIMHDYEIYDQACYFQSSVILILNLFNILPPEELMRLNPDFKAELKQRLLRTHHNEEKINKLIDFYNIITNYNDTYLLTKLYYFLLENGYEKYVKYIGVITNFSLESGFVLNILLKLLNQLDINVFNLCGLKLKDDRNVFLYNINEPEEIHQIISDEYKEYLYGDTLYGGEGKPLREIQNIKINMDQENFQDETILNDMPRKRIVKLNEYMNYDYNNILDLTDEIINIPEVLFININTLINNFTNISLKNKIDINEYYNIVDSYRDLYPKRINHQLYKNNYSDKFYIFDRFYFCNKFIRIHTAYYKIEMFIELTNGGHCSFIVNNEKFKNKYDMEYFNTISYSTFNNRITTVIPVIYVYKRCNYIDLEQDKTFERIKPRNPTNNLKKLNKNIDKDLLYNFIYGPISKQFEDIYIKPILNYITKIYNTSLRMSKKVKEEDITEKYDIIKQHLTQIKELYASFYKNGKKNRKDLFLFNTIFSNPTLINEDLLFILFGNYEYKYAINLIELISADKSLLNYLDYDKQIQQQQQSNYDFLLDLQQQ